MTAKKCQPACPDNTSVVAIRHLGGDGEKVNRTRNTIKGVSGNPNPSDVVIESANYQGNNPVDLIDLSKRALNDTSATILTHDNAVDAGEHTIRY